MQNAKCHKLSKYTSCQFTATWVDKEKKNAVLGRMGSSSTYPCPVYGGKPLLLQYGVALREVPAAEETPVGRQR